MAQSVTSRSSDKDILQALVEALHGEKFQAHGCPGHSDHNVHAEHAVCRVLSRRPSSLRWANGKTDAQIAQDAIKGMREFLREEEKQVLEHEAAHREHRHNAKAARRENREAVITHFRAILDAVINKK